MNKDKENKLNFDYSNLIVLSKLKNSAAYNRYYYYINSGKCKKIKTPMGVAIDVNEYRQVIKQNQKALNRPQIDLTEITKFNALYVRLNDLTVHNRIAVTSQSNKKIPRYIDQDGYTIINIMDYIEPQIKVLASKLNVKYVVVKKLLMELIQDIYKEKNRN